MCGLQPSEHLSHWDYRGLLQQKRRQVGDKAGKLKGGLQKLAETGVQVGEMQIVCQEKKVVVAQAKISCEELLVAIVQDKRAADEQEKQVATGTSQTGCTHLPNPGAAQPEHSMLPAHMRSGLLLGTLGRQQQPSSHGCQHLCRQAGSTACSGFP